VGVESFEVPHLFVDLACCQLFVSWLVTIFETDHGYGVVVRLGGRAATTSITTIAPLRLVGASIDLYGLSDLFWRVEPLHFLI